MVRRVVPSSGPIVRTFLEYISLSNMSKGVAARANVLKSQLMEHAAAHGWEDEKGHLVFNLDADVEKDGTWYAGFMRQRRVSQSFNEEKAEALLAAKGIDEEQYVSYQRYVDQDKVSRLYADDVLTDEEYQSLIDQTETWAFVPVKR